MTRRKQVEQEQEQTVVHAEESVETKEEQSVEQSSEQHPVKQYIYCGPTLQGGLLQEFSIFKGEVPFFLDEHIKNCPAIQALMVEPKDLTKVRQKIATVGTREHNSYNKIIEYVRGGK